MALEGASRDAVGIFLQLVATFLAAMAYVLQKKAHANAAAKKSTSSIYRNPLWALGFAFMVVTALLDVYSFSLMDQSKLAAFGAVTMAWNVILAAVILKEKFTRIDGAAVVVISFGTVLALWAAAADSKDFTFSEILSLLDDDAVWAYSILVGGTVIAGALYIEKTTKVTQQLWTPFQSWVVAVGSPMIGGACMGFTGYAAKALSAAIFHADWDQLAAAPFYVYLAIAGIAVSGQVRYLNKALHSFDAMSVVPVFQGAIILSNSLAGIVYYRDLRDESAGRKFAFAVGALATIGGVNILLLKARKSAAYDAAIEEGTEAETAAGGKATGVKASDSVADLSAITSPMEGGEVVMNSDASTPAPQFAFGAKPASEGAGVALVSALHTTLSNSFVQIARSASAPGGHHTRVASNDKEDTDGIDGGDSASGGGGGVTSEPPAVEMVPIPRSSGVISRARTISSGSSLSASGNVTDGRKPSLSLGHNFSLRDVKVHGSLLEPVGGEETPEPDGNR